MRKVLFFAYQNYADFEVAHALFFLRKVGKAKVTTVTLAGGPIESLGGLVTAAQVAIHEIQVRDYDLILISGGDTVDVLIEEPSVIRMLQQAHLAGIPIAAMCASAVLLGKAGLLREKSFTCLPDTFDHFEPVFEDASYTGADVEVAEGIITAKGTAFAEFTVTVGRAVGMWKDEMQAEKALRFCKGD